MSVISILEILADAPAKTSVVLPFNIGAKVSEYNCVFAGIVHDAFSLRVKVSGSEPTLVAVTNPMNKKPCPVTLTSLFLTNNLVALFSFAFGLNTAFAFAVVKSVFASAASLVTMLEVPVLLIVTSVFTLIPVS